MEKIKRFLNSNEYYYFAFGIGIGAILFGSSFVVVLGIVLLVITIINFKIKDYMVLEDKK